MELFFKFFLNFIQVSDKQTIGQRLEKVIAGKRVKSRRTFALSIGADPSFFDKMVRGSALLTENYADNIERVYGVNKEWLFSGIGEPYVDLGIREPSTMQILDRLSQAFIDQAAAFRAQAELMRSIESKMAQESTQARLEKEIKEVNGKLDSNLIRTLALAEKLSIVQDRSQKELMNELSELRSLQNRPLRGERKSKHQNDGDGQKPGKKPA